MNWSEPWFQQLMPWDFMAFFFTYRELFFDDLPIFVFQLQKDIDHISHYAW